MHTDTQSHKARLKHRWMLVLPLYLAFVGLSLSPWARAEIVTEEPEVWQRLTSEDAALPFSQDADIRGFLEARGIAQLHGRMIELLQGSVIVQSQDMVSVRVEGTELAGINGAFEVSQSPTLTVIALTTPVLVQRGDARHIVPTGYQWRMTDGITPLTGDLSSWLAARRMQPLPGHFIEQTLARLHTLDVPSADRTVTDAIAEPLTEQFWLLSSFHPSFRAQAWVGEVPADVSADAVAARLFFLPLSDQLADPAHPLVSARWQMETGEYLAAQEDADVVLRHISPIFDTHIARLKTLEYPQRLALWQKTFKAVTAR